MTFIYKLKTGVMDIQTNSEIATWKSSSPGLSEPDMAIPLRETSNGGSQTTTNITQLMVSFTHEQIRSNARKQNQGKKKKKGQHK